MTTSWPKFVIKCKSRISVLARELFLSREHLKAIHAEQIDELRSEIKELESRCKQAETATERCERLLDEETQRTTALEKQLEEARRSIQLPDDRLLEGSSTVLRSWP